MTTADDEESGNNKNDEPHETSVDGIKAHENGNAPKKSSKEDPPGVTEPGGAKAAKGTNVDQAADEKEKKTSLIDDDDDDDKPASPPSPDIKSPFWSSDEEGGGSPDQRKDHDDPSKADMHLQDENVEDFDDEPKDLPKRRRKLLTRRNSSEKRKKKKQGPLEKMARWTVHHADETLSPPSSGKRMHAAGTSTSRSTTMTREEIEMCEQLDLEYERALEEREVGYAARYTSVRQAAFLSVSFMLIYLTLGTTFLLREQDQDLKLNDALLFLIYSITTVGYGHLPFPETVRFQVFVIFFIFIGIATLTIMVAQCYQWIALEATRAQHYRDKADLEQRSKDMILASNSARLAPAESDFADDASLIIAHRQSCCERMGECCMGMWTGCKLFFLQNQLGRALSVLFPFVGLIGIGAGVVGPIEGWTVVESIYFAVVSLTTVGFGDYFPTRTASIWFCIFWLPFSIGFMSLFLSNVAHFYIRLSDKNIARLEVHMRRKLQKEKEALHKERSEALKRALRGQEEEHDLENGDYPNEHDDEDEGEDIFGSSPTRGRRHSRRQQRGFATLPDDEDDMMDEDNILNVSGAGGTALFGSPESEQSIGQIHREQVLSKSKYRPFEEGDDSSEQEQSMSTMKDVLETVKENVGAASSSDSDKKRGAPESRFMSISASGVSLRNSVISGGAPQLHKKPSFALRVLVQERFAEIIAMDVAGFQSNVEIQDDTLSVTIDALKNIADKWLIPRRARKAFRAVAFEALYFVGEHGLITRGADALYDLTPFEFHGLFSPLVAAMGDADTMSGWLASTQVLAEVDLKRESSRGSTSDGVFAPSYAQRVRMSREQEKGHNSGRSGSGTAANSSLSKRRSKKRIPADDHVLT